LQIFYITFITSISVYNACRVMVSIVYFRCHRPVSAGSGGSKFPYIHCTTFFSDCAVLYATIWKFSKRKQ